MLKRTHYIETAFRWAVLVMVSLLVSGSASATSILIVRTDGQVLIATDSLASDLNGTLYPNTCKIMQIGKVVFTAAGLESREFNCSPAMIAIRACASGGTLHQQVDRFEKQVLVRLTDLLELMRTRTPDLYRHYDGGAKLLLQAAFVCAENGVLKVEIRDFQLTNTYHQPVSIGVSRTSCPGDCGTDPRPIVYMMGEKEKIEGFISQNRSSGSPPNWIGLLNQAITLEFDGKRVGPPVDILLITTRGAKWIQRKAQCVPQQPQQPAQPDKGVRTQSKERASGWSHPSGRQVGNVTLQASLLLPEVQSRWNVTLNVTKAGQAVTVVR